MSSSILAISASVSSNSKSALLADHILENLPLAGMVSRHLRLRDLPPAALLTADLQDRHLAAAVEAVEAADGLVVATPIYKASYSGLLKVFLDSLPQFALAGKAVLPCATGGSLAHVLALDYALRPVLHSMGARHVVQSQFVLDQDVAFEDGRLSLGQPSEAGLREAVHHFRRSLEHAPPELLLGHPRPTRTGAQDVSARPA